MNPPADQQDCQGRWARPLEIIGHARRNTHDHDGLPFVLRRDQFNRVAPRDSRGCEPARSGPVRRRGRAIIRIATLLAPCATAIFSQPGLSCSGARSKHHGGLGVRNSSRQRRRLLMKPHAHYPMPTRPDRPNRAHWNKSKPQYKEAKI